VPLYDFICQQCGLRFEALIRRHIDDPFCPGCQGRDLTKLISMFAVDSSDMRVRALKSGREHASKDQREKARADREYMEKHLHHED
jgi:putative FmdB family regulatory protein